MTLCMCTFRLWNGHNKHLQVSCYIHVHVAILKFPQKIIHAQRSGMQENNYTRYPELGDAVQGIPTSQLQASSTYLMWSLQYTDPTSCYLSVHVLLVFLMHIIVIDLSVVLVDFPSRSHAWISQYSFGVFAYSIIIIEKDRKLKALCHHWM